MNTEGLLDMMKAKPFRPFHIKTTDGDTFLVEHPDFVMRLPKRPDIIVHDRDGHFRVIDLNLVVTLEPVKEKSPRKLVGKK